MSVYVVPDAHVFLLVNACAALEVRYVRHGGELHDLRGLFTDGRDEAGQTLAGRIASQLHAENVASVNYRYGRNDDALPFDDVPMMTWAAIKANSVDVLDAIRGYEYQSCEHPGWTESFAAVLCEALTTAAIAELPRPDGQRCWSMDDDKARRLFGMRGGAFAGL